MRAHIKRMELADIFAVGFILHHTLAVFKRFNVFSVRFVPRTYFSRPAHILLPFRSGPALVLSRGSVASLPAAGYFPFFR